MILRALEFFDFLTPSDRPCLGTTRATEINSLVFQQIFGGRENGGFFLGEFGLKL